MTITKIDRQTGEEVEGDGERQANYFGHTKGAGDSHSP